MKRDRRPRAARCEVLARLLRRNPTDAERILWQALTTDRRFAAQFKRQTPVGKHIPGFCIVYPTASPLRSRIRARTETVVRDRALHAENGLPSAIITSSFCHPTQIENDLEAVLREVQNGIEKSSVKEA